jgi:ribosomal protein L24
MLKKYLNTLIQKISFFKNSKGIISLISEDEALKILNFINKDNLTVEKVIERANKYIENNNPYHGGSFYIQNKIYYSKLRLLPICKNYNEYNLKLQNQNNKKKMKIKNNINQINQTLNKKI